MAKEFETGKVCHIRALWEHRQCRRVNNKLKQSVEDRRRYAGWESKFLQALMMESHARKQSRRYIVRNPNPSKLHFLLMTAYHDVLQTPTNRGSQKLQETRCHFYARGQPTLSTAFHFTPTRQSQVDTEAWPSFYDTRPDDRFRRRGINSHSSHYVSGGTESGWRLETQPGLDIFDTNRGDHSEIDPNVRRSMNTHTPSMPIW